MLTFYVVIPARYASTRLPRKPLLLISGKPMVIRVAEQAIQSGALQTFIATDHPEIYDAALSYGYQACLTKQSHLSGTDRVAEVVNQQGWEDDAIIVNVQGDEPLIPPELIRAVASHLDQHPECAVATAAHAIHDEASMRNPNVVKIVTDKNLNALYFSRAPIPYPRDAFSERESNQLTNIAVNNNINSIVANTNRDSSKSEVQTLPPNLPVLRHIGIYAYRASFLRTYHLLPPCDLEQFEALEQLRVLYHGFKIGVFLTKNAPPNGVDTEQDLKLARTLFDQQNSGKNL